VEKKIEEKKTALGCSEKNREKKSGLDYTEKKTKESGTAVGNLKAKGRGVRKK